MAGRLEGKVCMITGTGGGIGRASALAFAREGARVIGCDSNSSAAQRTLEEVLAANGEMISMHFDGELHIVFMLCKAAWAALCESSGNIINMASTAGHTTFRMFPAIAHTSAKGAIIAMTRHLAMEGRQHGIRANSISPGVIGTPAVLAQAQVPEWDAAMRGRMMRGRYGRPEEVAAVAVFLASDESSFINAADIVVDDGLTAWG